MSSLTAGTKQVAPAPRTVAEPSARFRDLVTAEWVKLWTLRSTYWVLGLGMVAMIAIAANDARNDMVVLSHPSPIPAGLPKALLQKKSGPYDALGPAFVPPAYQIFAIITGSVGAIAVFSEYSTGLVRTTFSAVPDRRAVVAAKITVLTVVMLAVGAVTSTASFYVVQAIVHSRHLDIPITAPGAARAISASTLFAPVCALSGMGFAALLRHSAASVLTTLGVLLVLPEFFTGDRYEWVKSTGNAMPLVAWTRLVDNPVTPHDWGKWPETIRESWTVFGVWFLVSALIAMVVVHRRDI